MDCIDVRLAFWMKADADSSAEAARPMTADKEMAGFCDSL